MREKFKELFSRRWTLSQSNRIKRVIKSFSIGEKVIFYIFILLFVVSALSLLWQVNERFMTAIPAHGGTLTEGDVGSPRFVNPVLAISDTDNDLTALIYSGLLKQNAQGTLVPDLAENYTVSEDGLTYTFTLKKNVKFSDGTALTADDVVFTVQKVQDQAIKSPEANMWNGVTVSAPNPQTIVFILAKAYAPFIYNTTIGILPKHVWKNVSDDGFAFSSYNIHPVGSGPYAVSKVSTDNTGLPVEYTLKANAKYISGTPFINTIVMKFYTNESAALSAYNSGSVDAINSVSPENMTSVKQNGTTYTAALSRVFGIFWNQSNAAVLVHPEVRQALDTAIDKPTLIDQVLQGYGVALNGPLPTDVLSPDNLSPDDRIAAAKSILEKAGWTLNSDGVYQKVDKKNPKNTETLTFSLSTSDAPELKAAADAVQTTWQKMGAQVDVKIFEIGDLNQNIIRPRKYDALLFGEIIPPGGDLYPFWDSSERNDPGLNIALYANVTADNTLTQLRATTDSTAAATLLASFEKQIMSDRPAVFLYAPNFIYVLPKDVHNVELGNLTSGSDRFADVNEWYIETTHVWKIFNRQVSN